MLVKAVPVKWPEGCYASVLQAKRLLRPRGSSSQYKSRVWLRIEIGGIWLLSEWVRRHRRPNVLLSITA